MGEQLGAKRVEALGQALAGAILLVEFGGGCLDRLEQLRDTAMVCLELVDDRAEPGVCRAQAGKKSVSSALWCMWTKRQ